MKIRTWHLRGWWRREYSTHWRYAAALSHPDHAERH
ncbi:Uncharacterised protein [Vibrio cholerae]|nr:Uncharacterised protein [Vibrio cholerae]